VQSHLREVFEAVGNEVQDLYAQHDVLSHRAQSQETSVEALTKHKAQLEVREWVGDGGLGVR